MSLLTLEAQLAQSAVPGTLVERLPEGTVRCVACGHRCLIREGRRGVCLVRFNRGGTLYVPRGYVGALQCDPIEKKPFFHVLPGVRTLSFGMLGCDYHCSYCQNWLTSQTLRDPSAGVPPQPVTPEQLVGLAIESGSQVIASTYNEPLITSEWAVEVFKAARARGLLTAYVSNGNATPEVLEYLRPWVDAYKVDLKGFNEG
ncbi:MAG: radical SAM protein, partial [Candidatus Omnitrophica bacterium]|nr:radical SAM protein [Candidatus Omnitrophota bacterium]